jgi:hypothetical protein
VKAGRLLEVLAVNAALLLGLYLVLGDVASRTAYAAREGFTYSFTQSFLLETSTLQGAKGIFQSPLTLAWPQLLVAVLLIVDVLYLYSSVNGRRRKSSERA